MEMAMCASLPAAKGRENPSVTTTYGVGQLIRHAVDSGNKKILVGPRKKPRIFTIPGFFLIF